MMSRTPNKMKAEDRREIILSKLMEADSPITGSSLAEAMNVTRQVIVGDISLLKARNEPIVATSQGYMFLSETKEDFPYKKRIVCQHTSEQTEHELNLIVDHGVFVEDVVVEHPVYGDLTAFLRISNRRDVRKFIDKVRSTNASFLLELTGGIHMHTLASDSNEALGEAIQALADEGILMKTE